MVHEKFYENLFSKLPLYEINDLMVKSTEHSSRGNKLNSYHPCGA